MHHEVKKISKIVDELMTFFLKEDTNEVDFNIKRESGKSIISITDYNTRFDDESIEQISETLNVQRQLEIEAYYWQLCGETDCDDELLLVGAMVDEAYVEKNNGNLVIRLVRNL